MASACLDKDGFALPVNRLNFFSNPDLVHNGRPTGTVDSSCVRRLRETMVREYSFDETVGVWDCIIELDISSDILCLCSWTRHKMMHMFVR